jgi:hypothetical protein
MSNSPAPSPSPEEALRLYQRLLEKDLTASNDLAVAYLEPLTTWLCKTNRRIHPEFCEEAAGAALVALINNPQSFAPDRQSLEVYLRLSAQGDLRNLLAREKKHHQNRVGWKIVEHSPDAGKYLGRADDPSLPLQMAEEVEQTAEAVPDSIWAGLSDQERQVLQLMLQKERKTSVYARVCGLEHLPFKEQQKEIRRIKNRITKRLQRARGTDDHASGQVSPTGDE